MDLGSVNKKKREKEKQRKREEKRNEVKEKRKRKVSDKLCFQSIFFNIPSL